MGIAVESLIEGWDGLGVVTSRHSETGTWIFVALHDETLGRPTGGCRLKSYGSPALALLDAMRLAEGMTWKWAAMGYGYGGGKSVLAVPGPLEGEARRSLFRHFGRLLNGLGGAYGVGEDLGTTRADMSFLATVTPHVAGAADGGQPPDPSPFTAVGVHAGIVACVAHLFGSDRLAGRTVLVEGVGQVGRPLALLLARAGAKVITSDADEDRARSVAGECGGTVVDPRQVQDTECDVYAPCAVGATVNAATIPGLRCRIIAGSANNQLETPADADRLHERGILYAPDYVINGGGAMAFGLMDQGITDAGKLRTGVQRIGSSLGEILREADEAGTSPVVAADRIARKALRRE